MISRLFQRLDGLASSAILLREAARTSRRWQTYAARTAFSGALFGVLLLGVWGAMSATTDVATLGWLGRAVFVAFSVVLLLLSMTLSPLVTSGAMIEEAQDRTLEMLLLSGLTPSRILMGKVLSRILVLLTVVLGAMPVLAVVVSLGGVAPQEVVAVVVHAIVAVVFTGSLGAFYGLFTRSPMLATLASASFAFVAFLVFPAFYVLFTAQPAFVAHFSLFAGPASSDWAALFSPLSWLPGLGVLFVVGTRLFELRVSHADIRHAFSARTWNTDVFLKGLVVAFVGGFGALVAAGVLYTWRSTADPGALGLVLLWGASGYVWLWGILLATLLTWAMLRVGVDVVDALDAILMGSARRDDEDRVVRVGSNPVAWREARWRAWTANGLPLLGTWLLVMLGLVQTGWWLIPGGALAMGALNTAIGLGLTVWAAARSIDEERRHHSLLVLLTTPLASHRILTGKLLGVATLSGPIVLLSLPFFALGVPFASLFDLMDGQGKSTAALVFLGLLVWLWTVALWTVLAVGSLLIGLVVKRSRSGFAVAIGTLVVSLGLPAVLGHAFEHPLLVWPSRLVVPPLAGSTSPLQYVGSILAWFVLAGVLFGVTSHGLRRWIAAGLAVLLTGLPVRSARAQVPAEVEVLAEPVGDGVVRPDRWAAVRVRLTNHGEPTRATVALPERDGSRLTPYRRVVDLPHGRKDVLLLYRPGTSRLKRTVQVTHPRGQAIASFRVRHAGAADATVGVFGLDPLGIQEIVGTEAPGIPGRFRRPDAVSRTVHVGLVEPGALPRHAAAWEAFDQLVWPDPHPERVDPMSLTALAHWVADGGHLVVSLTENPSHLHATPLGPLLPLDLERSVPVDVGASGGPSWSHALPAGMPMAVGSTRPLEDRTVFTLLEDRSGRPLWTTASYGLGAITLLTFHPSLLPDEVRPVFWRDVLRLPGAERLTDPLRATRDGELLTAARPALDDQLHAVPVVRPDREPWSDPTFLIQEWLTDIPGLAPLPLGWLLGFAGLYLLVIGPVDGLVLRVLRRQPLTWITFPVTIVLFSSVALVGTSWVKGDEAVVTSLTRVDLLPGTGLWRGTTRIGVFATSRTEITVAGAVEDAVAAPEEGFVERPRVSVGLGPGRVGWSAETWTQGRASVRWIDQAPGTVRVERTADGLVLENGLPFPLADAQVREPTQPPSLWEAGPVAPGQRVLLRARAGDADEAPLPTGVEASDDATELDRLRRMLGNDQAPGEGELLLHEHDAVVFASIDPVHPPVLTGVQPRFQRATLLRVPVTIARGSP